MNMKINENSNKENNDTYRNVFKNSKSLLVIITKYVSDKNIVIVIPEAMNIKFSIPCDLNSTDINPTSYAIEHVNNNNSIMFAGCE